MNVKLASLVIASAAAFVAATAAAADSRAAGDTYPQLAVAVGFLISPEAGLS